MCPARDPSCGFAHSGVLFLPCASATPQQSGGFMQDSCRLCSGRTKEKPLEKLAQPGPCSSKPTPPRCVLQQLPVKSLPSLWQTRCVSLPGPRCVAQHSKLRGTGMVPSCCWGHALRAEQTGQLSSLLPPPGLSHFSPPPDTSQKQLRSVVTRCCSLIHANVLFN